MLVNVNGRFMVKPADEIAVDQMAIA